MAKPNPAAELAARLIARLEELRSAGDGYPIRLDELLASVSPDTPSDLRAKALKQGAFKSRTLQGHAKRPDAPVALADDVDRFATSLRLFEFACRCSPSGGPPWNVAELKKLVPKPLQAGFERACVERRNQGDRSLALTNDEWQALRLLNALNATPPSGDGALASTPLTLRVLAERAGFNPLRDATKLKKLASSPQFAASAAVLLDKSLDSPIVAARDAAQLARPDVAIPALLAAARTDKKRIQTLKNLLKKAAPALRPAIQEAVARCLEAGDSLGQACAVRDGKEFKFFLLSDLEPPVLRRRLSSVSQERGDFATSFEAAFTRLDAESGGHNQVSLLPLRAALGRWSRDEFDSALEQLRLTGRFVLSGLQNRGGMSPEEQAAGIREAGLLRVYVSRRR